MGNFGSYGGGNTYANPFVMVDYSDNINANNKNNRFACDLEVDTNRTNIEQDINQKVKNYTLASMFKHMVVNYDGSKDKDTNTYISSPGNNLPGGKYLDANGNHLKLYKTMACCKGAIGTNAIGVGDSNNPKKSVSIPILTVVRPNKDNLKPIYSDQIDNTTNKITSKGINTTTNTFYFHSDYIDKINKLTPEQLDTIITQCAHGSMCLKSNIVGLQIQEDPTSICGDYKPVGQTSATNQTAETTAICHSVMKHICAKQLYDQGCINMRYDSKLGLKKPSWFNSPQCSSYDFNTDVIGKNFFSGTPDCTCINSMSGYSLNNKPKLSTIENPYQLSTSGADSKYYSSDGATPYALNVWNFNPSDPNYYNATQPGNYTNGEPGQDDPDCVKSITLPYGSYLLPIYYVTIVGTVCKNIMTFNGINADEFIAYNINQTNLCGKAVANTKSGDLANAEQAAIQAARAASQNAFNTEQAAIQAARDASQNAFNTEQAAIQASRTASTISPSTTKTPITSPSTTTSPTTSPSTTTSPTTTTSPSTTTTTSTTMSTTNIIIIVSVIGSVILLLIIISFIFIRKR